MAEPDDDAKLREVKVVLARLQRMSSDPEEYFAEASEPPPAKAGSVDRRKGRRETGAKAETGSGPRSSRLLKVGAGALALVLISGSALYIFQLTSAPPRGDVQITLEPPPPPSGPTGNPPPAPRPTPMAPPLTAPGPLPSAPSSAPHALTPEPNPAAAAAAEAMRLISSGQVQSGRALLLSMAATQLSADVAWSLARSYDPNLLATLASPDAAADVAEAERWYREWHALALKEGLVSGTSSVDRILRSLK